MKSEKKKKKIGIKKVVASSHSRTHMSKWRRIVRLENLNGRIVTANNRKETWISECTWTQIDTNFGIKRKSPPMEANVKRV